MTEAKGTHDGGTRARAGDRRQRLHRQRGDQTPGAGLPGGGAGPRRTAAPPPPAEADAVDFDLGTEEGVAKAMETVRARFGGRIASVVHLAAYFDVSGKANPLHDKITVQGARRLIEGLRGFEVGQFILASTMLVHQPTDRPDKTINEDSPIAPGWAYPESKVKSEAVLREAHGDIPLVLLRIAGVYDDLAHSPFIAEHVARIYEHRLTAHVYPGMLCAGQSFIHLEDLVDAIAKLVARRAQLPPELPLLLGEPEALGYGEVQDIIGRTLHGEDWDTVRIPKPVAKLGAWLQTEALGDQEFVKPWMVDQSNDHYVLDVTRARTLLDWTPQHSLRATLPKIVDALKRDPVAWYETNGLDSAVVAWNRPHDASHAPAQDAAVPAEPARTGDQMAHHPAPSAAADAAPVGQHATHGEGGNDHMAVMDADARRVRWAHFANIGLGLWLAASPFIYDGLGAAAASPLVRAVTEARGLASLDTRAAALFFSDLLSGLAIAAFGVLSLSKRTAWFAQWANTFVGLWLLFAPMLFWTPSAAQYLNDTLVGVLVIAFSVLIPMMPGMSMAGMMDPKNIPPGWTYCPSTWAQRLPIALLGLIGLLISRVLTAYQLGHIDGVFEPFFGGDPANPQNGTEEIVTSSVSKAWPIPDAGLGAISYTLEILMAVMGGRDRWRTMPWMVTFFGILVIPLGVVSIYFIIIQPIVIGTWCTLCLLAALAMLIMIPFALDEVIAMGQYLWWVHCTGKPVIRTFFQGGPVDAGAVDEADALASPSTFWKDSVRGMTFPWTLVVSVAIGALQMLTRVLFGASGAMANSDHVVGALVITVAIIATSEVARAVRLVNAALGLWLVAAPFLLSGDTPAGRIASIALGLALLGLSLPRGRRSPEHYASWDRLVL